ncbi:MAG TPA: hypothetical protein VE398_01715 [Acidobacteriota bacterium]|nr:hypothetical protein [Acidobacteriota bacterium]
MIWTTRTLKLRSAVPILSFAILLGALGVSSRLALAQKIDAGALRVFPFYDRSDTGQTGTYLFGLLPCSKQEMALGQPVSVPGDNAANWWRVRDDPRMGFEPVVSDAKMSPDYIALTSFELNNRPYIFGLHRVGANIWRINDNPTTGFTLVKYKGKMSPNYEQVVSFQLKGQPYILGLHEKLGANIWSIREGPNGLTWDLVNYKAKMSPNHRLAVVYIKDHPHILGIHPKVGATLWRVKDDPSQGLELVMYGAKFPRAYNFILPFQLDDGPYLLAGVSQNYLKDIQDAVKDIPTPPESGPVFDLGKILVEKLIDIIGTGWVEWGKGYACIWKITGEAKPLGITKISQTIPISHRYVQATTFEHSGKVYFFAIHEEGFANIWRINDDPATGFTLEYYGRDPEGFRKTLTSGKSGS